MRWRSALVIAAVSATGALLLFACGGGESVDEVASLSDTPTTAAGDEAETDAVEEQDREQQFLEFTACLREEGLDISDPTFDDNGRPQFGDEGGALRQLRDDPDAAAVMEACGDVRPELGARSDDPAVAAERADRFNEFAGCMREQGIDMPDADPTTGRPQLEGQEGIDASDADFQAAANECREAFGGDRGGPLGPPRGGGNGGAR